MVVLVTSELSRYCRTRLVSTCSPTRTVLILIPRFVIKPRTISSICLQYVPAVAPGYRKQSYIRSQNNHHFFFLERNLYRNVFSMLYHHYLEYCDYCVLIGSSLFLSNNEIIIYAGLNYSMSQIITELYMHIEYFRLKFLLLLVVNYTQLSVIYVKTFIIRDILVFSLVQKSQIPNSINQY